MILEGSLPPGSPLREEQLADVCGVSRTPIRDALRRLEAEAFVRRSESQRSFVADWSLDDIEEAFQLRSKLEGHAARRAAVRASWDQIERLKFHNLALERAIGLPEADVPAFLEHNRQFHSIIIEAAASTRLAGMLAQLVEQPVVFRTAHQYDRENLVRSHREHQELLAAFARGDGEWAEAVMVGHIRRAFHAYADAHRRGISSSGEQIDQEAA
jgi:DNA-binding GntR family transcriptional regulator